MILRSLLSQRLNGTLVQQFGQARLVRHRNGEHELIGGSTADRMAAFEWASLFAHEIVFTHFQGRADLPARKSAGLPHLLMAVN
jgi:hypothetical protein